MKKIIYFVLTIFVLLVLFSSCSLLLGGGGTTVAGNDDSSLSNLTVSVGSISFSSTTTSYTIDLSYDVTSITITSPSSTSIPSFSRYSTMFLAPTAILPKWTGICSA